MAVHSVANEVDALPPPRRRSLGPLWIETWPGSVLIGVGRISLVRVKSLRGAPWSIGRRRYARSLLVSWGRWLVEIG